MTEQWTPKSPAPSPEEIEAARTVKGAFRKRDLESWGVPWPAGGSPPRGWQKVLKEAYQREQRLKARS